jgi:tetratricopeptide (TPR) repeat protein
MSPARIFAALASFALAQAVPALAAPPESLRPVCENTDGKALNADRISACTQLIALKQGDARARAMVHVNRAWSYGLDKQWDKAMADYNEAARIAPDFSVVYNEKGLARLKMGRPDEAVINYDKAIKLDPKAAYSFFGRGLAKAAKGNAQGAAQDFDTARALDRNVDAVFERIGFKP